MGKRDRRMKGRRKKGRKDGVKVGRRKSGTGGGKDQGRCKGMTYKCTGQEDGTEETVWRRT